MEKTVIELFAGVGGFRVGLNHVTLVDGKTIEEPNFKFVWANQWEPSTKIQHAFNCYKTRFSKGNDDEEFSNSDISLVDKKSIPDHTLLTGGFPCQDYSVARSLSKEMGIEGKKGVLWWQINDILKAKKPPFVLLENVDRLTKAPSKQRGRDFGIILRCFEDNGYSVEYRIINAAEYGHVQRRRRTFIFAYKNKTVYGKKQAKLNAKSIFETDGIFAKAFPIKPLEGDIKEADISKEKYADLLELQKDFAFQFENAGYMHNGKVYTFKTIPDNSGIHMTTLGEIQDQGVIDKTLYLNKKKLGQFDYLKGAKHILRTARNGHKYFYSEGPIARVDLWKNPGRTMLTSEGTVNRSTHVVEDEKGQRILTAIEAERMDEFPDNWTDTMPYKKRYFMMGNALVCGIIRSLGECISLIIDAEK